MPLLPSSTFTPPRRGEEQLSVAQSPHPPSLAFSFLILFLHLLRKQFEPKDAWLRAAMAQPALICSAL